MNKKRSIFIWNFGLNSWIP
ncbi:hypothetical protein LINPERHAP1_LOCUS45234 [Linum perenne]